MSVIVSIGIDLTKNAFAVHRVDATAKPALVRPSLPRAKLLELIATLPPCIIGMEACSGGHYGAREFQRNIRPPHCQAPPDTPTYRPRRSNRTERPGSTGTG